MCMHEDVNWSMQYFKNNVDAVAFAHCHAQYMLFPVNQRGGPLFLKILIDHLTTSDNCPKESLLKSVKVYKITSIGIKDIQQAYNQLLAVAETLYVLNDNVLPPNMIKVYLEIFTTTSCTKFNE